MSKYATIIFCFVLLVLVAIHLVDSSAVDLAAALRMQPQDDDNNNNNNSNNQLDQNHRSSINPSSSPSTGYKAWRNIGLVELTPSLEQQLYQARRLNSGDPGSLIELKRLANEPYRYEVEDGNSLQQPTQAGINPKTSATTTQSRLSRQAMKDLHLFNGAHWPSDKTSDNHGGKRPIGASNNNGIEFRQFRFSRASSMAPFGRSETAAAVGSRLANSEQDGAYYDSLLDGGTSSSAPSTSSSVSPASIGNQEDASRKSLWTSELLRDLLIAQEARNRARLIEKLTRSIEHDRGTSPNSINLQDTSEREKRRRCKADPNLGVKNPSFCDTDAYFGAADYGMRDVWDSAGR